MNDSSSRYLSLFLAGAREHLDQIETSLASLARGQDEDAVASLRRALHSLKGMAATMGHADLAVLAHSLEDVFREGGAAGVAPDLLGALLQASGCMSRFLDALERSAPTPDLSGWPERIHRLAAGGSPAREEPEPATVRLPATVRVSLKDLDYLLAEATDLTTLADRRAAGPGEPSGSRTAAPLRRGITRLHRRITRMRLISCAPLVPTLERMVEDCARRSGKRARLEIQGQDLLMDRATLDLLLDPLIHLLRNGVAHGLERPAARLQAGKPEEGRISVAFALTHGSVRVTVEDDGQGIDRRAVSRAAERTGSVRQAALAGGSDLTAILCRPGLSTAHGTTQVAGRGIGLDAVRETVVRAGGRLVITSPAGQGLHAVMQVPRSVSIVPCLLARAGDTTYGFPLSGVSRVQVRSSGTPAPARPVVPLERLLPGATGVADGNRRMLVWLSPGGEECCAALVDQVLGRLDAVIRPLPAEMASAALAGTASRTDGTPVAILDLFGLDLPGRAVPLPAATDACPSSG
ncbi:MAG: chemotaxis protein CheA [Acidobacteriota bacterium]